MIYSDRRDFANINFGLMTENKTVQDGNVLPDPFDP
jgi:hypothetical protein